jgi:hypothetical protein
MPDQQDPPGLIPPHGGYRDLKSYQMAEMVLDAPPAWALPRAEIPARVAVMLLTFTPTRIIIRL